MKKECTYIFLPTEQKSNILLVTTNEMAYRNRPRGKMELHDSPHEKSEDFEPQHIYIFSDEEIKDGDWYLDGTTDKKNILKVTNEIPIKLSEICKKIIATTNPKLWNEKLEYSNPDDIFPMGKSIQVPKVSKSDTECIIDLYNRKNKIMMETKPEDVWSSYFEEAVDKAGLREGVIEVMKVFADIYLQNNNNKKFTLEDVYSILAFTERETRYNARGVKEFITGEIALNYRIVEEWNKEKIESPTKEKSNTNTVIVEYEKHLGEFSVLKKSTPFPYKPKLKDGNIIVYKI